MRITKEQIELMRKMYSQGKTQMELAKELKIPQSKVSYWVGKKTRETSIKNAKERFNRLTPKQKREYYQSRREYNRIYMNNRYRNDPDFKNKIRERSKIWKRKKTLNLKY